MKLIRVFPRRTRATPIDRLAYVGGPDMFAEADAVHISVAFTWDLPAAERLAREWRHVAAVTIGGPATGESGGDFEPGRYLREGYVITSRGCPNRCWFCSVWRREGETVRELPVRDGWNVLDDNLLACSDDHIRAVFGMLSRQKHPVEFTGGFEAARLKPWHVEALRTLRPKQIFFAYDTPNDREPLFEAGKILQASGLGSGHRLRAYVLIGYPGDSFEAAEDRLKDCLSAGFMPMAMLYRDSTGQTDVAWRKFQRQWARPAIVSAALNSGDGRDKL